MNGPPGHVLFGNGKKAITKDDFVSNISGIHTSRNGYQCSEQGETAVVTRGVAGPTR